MRTCGRRSRGGEKGSYGHRRRRRLPRVEAEHNTARADPNECVTSRASFSPDKSGRHFRHRPPSVSVPASHVGDRRRHVAAAIGTFSNDKRGGEGEMDRKTAKKEREWESRPFRS